MMVLMMIRLSVWLVNGCARVFVLLSIVIVTLPRDLTMCGCCVRARVCFQSCVFGTVIRPRQCSQKRRRDSVATALKLFVSSHLLLYTLSKPTRTAHTSKPAIVNLDGELLTLTHVCVYVDLCIFYLRQLGP